LVDVTIGYTTEKMMKLKIDAIGCHIGGNLLVFVAEHKLLLSVWRVKKKFELDSRQRCVNWGL
jgi:hypothetical protein